MTTDLLARLSHGEVIVGDGAWGTLLMERGLPAGRPPEWFALERPEVLAHIARLYLSAGAELVTTDTFGGSSLRLRLHGLESDAERINRHAVEAVRHPVMERRANGAHAYVSASVGPTGLLLEPHGDAKPDDVAAAFRAQVRVLAEAGADLVCVKTMTDLVEATLAVKAARAVAPHLPVMATLTFDATPRGFFTVMGVSVAQAVAGLEAAGADIVGSNCGTGIDAMVELARELLRHARRPVAIQANAGLPETRAGALVYPDTPEHMAACAAGLLDLGVRVIGGCCGTTPAHVAALRRMVDDAARRAGVHA